MRTLLALALFAAAGTAGAHASSSASGCYVDLFANKQYRAPLVTYTGPMRKPFELSRAGSMVVGPGARLVGYAGQYRKESLDLPPGTHVPDLARLGLQSNVDSFQLVCGDAHVQRALRAKSARADRPVPALFRRLDRDGDGYLSESELDSAEAERGNWAALDRDGDRRISPDEFSALRSGT